MSVNLSVKQLQSETIIDDVREALEASALPSALVLEITETVMMADTDLAVRRLHELKSLGVLLAMDDFGTGYSSLSYLSRFPVDILKMDRSFLSSEHDESGLAAAIIALGTSTSTSSPRGSISEQIASLRELGCELGQGFLFAKPMNHEALVEYLGEEATRRAAVACSIVTSRSTARRLSGQPPRPARHRLPSPLGRMTALVGDGIFLIAMAWQAYELWNAPAALSLLDRHDDPTIAFLLPAGVLSDRLDRRTPALRGHGRAVVIGALAVLS